MHSPVKVCVIGAGANGLVSARHASEIPNAQVTVFEAGEDIGGLWSNDEKNEFIPKYKEESETDAYYQYNKCYHGSIYKGLKAVVPYFFMTYKDLNHADVMRDVPILPDKHHHKIYLDAYASKFDLRSIISLNTLVTSVRLYANLSPEEKAEAPENKKFIVKTVDAKGKSLEKNVTTHAFDYVIVCSGKLSRPYIPNLKGLDTFSGDVIPAKSFIDPDHKIYHQKRILLLGSSYSAMDLIMQFLVTPPEDEEKKVKNLLLVGRRVKVFGDSTDFKPFQEKGQLTVVQAEVAEIQGKTVKLTDGSEYEVDTIILATGYQFTFPFFDMAKDKLIDFDPTVYRGKLFGPVYKRFVCAREPNLFFIGWTNTQCLSYVTYEAHAMIAKYVIAGKIALPSEDEMVESFKKDLEEEMTKKKTLVSFFNVSPLVDDIPYWNELRDMIKTAHPSNDEKAHEFYDPWIVAYRKMMEILRRGNIIEHENHDYHIEFPKHLRDTTEFI